MKRSWGLRFLIWLGIKSNCCGANITMWDTRKGICDKCGEVCE